jgi:hypothetical protein
VPREHVKKASTDTTTRATAPNFVMVLARKGRSMLPSTNC